MTAAEMVRELAVEYFHPETGEAAILRDEFNRSQEFIKGQRQGHSDAYAVLMGLVDWLEEDSRNE